VADDSGGTQAKGEKTMTPSLHDLNRVCAEFCGKPIVWNSDGDCWNVGFEPGGLAWNPCEDHNQGAEVKAKLREKGVEIVSMTVNLLNHWIVELITYKGKYEAKHESELIALALAIEAL